MNPSPRSGGFTAPPLLLPTPEGTARAYFAPDGSIHVLNLTPSALGKLEQLGLPANLSQSRIDLPQHPRRTGLGYVAVTEDQLPQLPLEALWALHDSTPLELFRPDSVSRLRLKLEIARRLAQPCNLCEHRCNALREEGQGWCRAPLNPSQIEAVLHVGEEVGQTLCLYLGPGCSHRCRFCTMHDLVNAQPGRPLEASLVAQSLPAWRARGAESLTVIGGEPGIYLPWILELLLHESSLPLVWNSNFYHTPEVARLLEGVVDVHVADLKFGNPTCARRLGGVVNYLEPLKRNLYLAASEGLPVVVRHVVMPGHLECCTRPALETITQIIPSAWVHLMPYLPAWQGAAYGLEGFSTQADLREACNMATSINLSLWKGTPI